MQQFDFLFTFFYFYIYIKRFIVELVFLFHNLLSANKQKKTNNISIRFSFQMQLFHQVSKLQQY